MSPDIIAFIAGAFTALLGSLTTHFLSKDIYRRNNFNQAAKDFIAAFQEELVRLKIESTSTHDIIKPALIKQMAAYYTFRGYLGGCKRKRITRAWQIYYVSTPPCPDNETDQKYADERTAIIERIEELLDFAKFK